MEKTWASEVKNILLVHGFGANWVNRQPVNLHHFQTRVTHLENTRLEQEFANSVKLQELSIIRENFTETAPHLLADLSKALRSKLSRLRLGLVPIRIETGRMAREPVNERVCPMCQEGKIENIEHWLFECSAYDQNRNALISKIGLNNLNLRNVYKFPYIFATYVNELWQIRVKSVHKCKCK